jgi:hypothetical protein
LFIMFDSELPATLLLKMVEILKKENSVGKD